MNVIYDIMYFQSMLPLFSEGTKHFTYYPFIPLGKWIETGDSICTVFEEINLNGHTKNPSNIIPYYAGEYMIANEEIHKEEVWNFLEGRRRSIYTIERRYE